MDIFVTGATGVLGRATLERLTARGHDVRGLARSDANAEVISKLGAEPADADLFDVESLKAAAKGADAILHLATKIPPMRKARSRKSWRENDRIRTEGTANLVEAARAAGVARLVAESIAFVYPDRGSEWIDESVALDTQWQASTSDLEAAVSSFTASGGSGTALRFGFFFGPEAESSREQIGLARRGFAPMLGPRDAYMPAVHTDDAADAVVASLDAPAGAYNVAAEPVTRAEYAQAVFDALAIEKQPRFMPRGLTRLVAGRAAEPMSRSWRVSNAAFGEAASWRPPFDVAAGWADTVARIDA